MLTMTDTGSILICWDNNLRPESQACHHPKDIVDWYLLLLDSSRAPKASLNTGGRGPSTYRQSSSNWSARIADMSSVFFHLTRKEQMIRQSQKRSDCYGGGSRSTLKPRRLQMRQKTIWSTSLHYSGSSSHSTREQHKASSIHCQHWSIPSRCDTSSDIHYNKHFSFQRICNSSHFYLLTPSNRWFTPFLDTITRKRGWPIC